MKISSSILAILLVFYGCKAIDELTHFDIDYNYTFTLNAPGAGINLDNLDIRSNDVENSTESTFENNDTRKDLIERATLKKFHVTILEPIDSDFSFLNKVEVFLSTAELDEKLIAWKDNIEDIKGNYLKLETTSNNLRKYLVSDKIKVRLKTTSSEPLTNDLLLDLAAKVEVDAKILGI
jgi:hypothetical protein